MKFLTKNLQLKIMALLSATALWFFVVGIQNTVYRFPEEIDIRTLNLSPDLSVVTDLGKAKILVRGSAEDFKNLVKSDIDISIDLKNLAVGEYTLPLQATIKNEKITLVRIEPKTITVKLETITKKNVKIKAFTSGNPQKGYSVKEVKALTTTATLSGPQSLLKSFESVNAEIVLNGTQSTNFKTNISLKLDAAAQNQLASFNGAITIDPAEVSVDVTIIPEFQEKTVIVKPNLRGAVNDAKPNQQIEVDPITIVIRGDEGTLNNIQYLETEPIYLESWADHSKPLRSKLILPKGVTLVEGEGDTVSVRLTDIKPKTS